VAEGVIFGKVKSEPFEEGKGIFRFKRSFQERDKTVVGIRRFRQALVVNMR